jgi:hypothetical protein
MKSIIKKLIPDSMIFAYRRNNALKELKTWENKGKPLPNPHIAKQLVIEYYHRQTGYNVLVETGTFMGDMIESQRRNFKTLYSIELSKELYEKAKLKFKKFNHIHLVQGDSAEKLEEIVQQLKEPAIFWLDGHYSGGVTAQGTKDCPVWEELDAILKKDLNHCILIDDARCFGTDPAYPTIPEIEQYLKTNAPDYKVKVEEDIIRLTKHS